MTGTLQLATSPKLARFSDPALTDDSPALLKPDGIVINNDLLINADAGKDYVKVDNVDVFDDLRLNAGSGDDAVTVRDSQADDITVYGGVGDDDVNLWHNRVTDQLYASLGTGNDSLWFWGNRVGRHYFNGGTGTDTWYASYDYFWTWANFYNFE